MLGERAGFLIGRVKVHAEKMSIPHGLASTLDAAQFPLLRTEQWGRTRAVGTLAPYLRLPMLSGFLINTYSLRVTVWFYRY